MSRCYDLPYRPGGTAERDRELKQYVLSKRLDRFRYPTIQEYVKSTVRKKLWWQRLLGCKTQAGGPE